MRKLFALSVICALAAAAPPQKITILQTNRAVCAYLGSIVGQPCRQAVFVAISSSDSTPEAFKVALTYRDSRGSLKTDFRIAIPTNDNASISAAATFFLDDVIVVSALVTPMVASGEASRIPED